MKKSKEIRKEISYCLEKSEDKKKVIKQQIERMKSDYKKIEQQDMQDKREAIYYDVCDRSHVLIKYFKNNVQLLDELIEIYV